jgi:hypothetical protein
MADLAQVAQSGVDPISGSYLSAERRKALFKKSQVSSNIFGGGGAIVPISKKSDPETLAIVKSQSTSITTVQSQVNTLSSEVANLNKVIFIQTQTINGVQELVGSLRGEITGFNNSLNNVTKAITNDSILEQNRVKKENEEQRRATELGLRAGRESLLEKAIQSALIAPVQAIAEKTQSILSRLSQFFGTLLLGWLTNQGIETLRALSEDNGKKLIEIRDNVLKALGIGAATLFLLNGGFFAIAATITRLSLKIGGWLLKNTVGRFFGALGNLLKGAGAALFGLGKQKPPPTPVVPAAPAAPNAGAGGRGLLSTASRLGRGLLRNIGGPLTQGTVGTALDIAMGEDPGRALAGAAAGVIAAAPSAAVGGLLGPVGSFAGGIAGYSVGSGFGKDIYDKFFGKPQTPVATSSVSAKPSPVKPSPAKPQSPVIPSSTKPPTTSAATTPSTTSAPAPASDMSFNQQMVDLEKQVSSIDFTQAPQYGEVNITPEEGNQVSPQPSQVNIKPLPAQTNRVSTQVNVGPAPAPAPNVVYKRIASSAQQRSGAAPTGGSVNQVPAISASNPDNFYVLYSQVNYNVVT